MISGAVAANNIKALKEANIPFIELSNMLHIVVADGTVAYYCGFNKWQHRGRNHMGDVATFIAWVRKKNPVHRVA